MGSGVADCAVLVCGLDTFGDDHGSELRAQAHDTADQLLASRVPIEVRDQLAIELHHLGLEVGDSAEVRVARAEIVDDEVNAATRPYLAQNVETQLKVRERHRLGDFEKYFVVVREDGIVGAHQPTIAQLVGVDVEEDRTSRAEGQRDLANHPPEASGPFAGDRVAKQGHGVGQLGDAAPDESLGGEERTGVDVDDGLKDDAQILFVHHPVHRQVGMALRIVERDARWGRRAPGRPLLRRLRWSPRRFVSQGGLPICRGRHFLKSAPAYKTPDFKVPLPSRIAIKSE